MTEPAVS